jgi:surface protein
MKKLLFLLLFLPICAKSTPFLTHWQTNGSAQAPDTVDFKIKGNGDTIFWKIWYLDSALSRINTTPDTSSFTRRTNSTIIYLINIRHTGIIELEIESKNLVQFSVEIASVDKIQTIEQWGSAKWLDMSGSFRDCKNLQINAIDVPDLSATLSLYEMFRGCLNLVGENLKFWDVSNITDMERMFSGAENFTADISNWDVSSVYEMSNMFNGSKKFNRDLSNWCLILIDEEPAGFATGTDNWDKFERLPLWGGCAVWIGPDTTANDIFSNQYNWLGNHIPDTNTRIIQISKIAHKDMRLDRHLSRKNSYILENINFRNTERKVILGDYDLQLNNFRGDKFWKFKTNGLGMLRQTVREDSTVRFDVGDSTYNPVHIKNESKSDTFSLRVYDFVLTSGLEGSEVTNISHVQRIWKILKTDTLTSKVNFQFEWQVENEYDGLPTGGFENAHLNTLEKGILNWEVAKSGNGSYNTGAQSLTHSGYSSYFNLFAINASTIPLPYVDYLFNAKQIDRPHNSVYLEWTFFNLNDIINIEIQRLGSTEWETLSGYNFRHKDAFCDNGIQDPGIYHYRLKVTDESGNEFTTVERSVLFKGSQLFTPIRVSPNPNRGNFNIHGGEDFEYRIYNLEGRVIKSGKSENGYVNICCLQSGKYYIRYFNNNIHGNENIVVN